MAKMKVHELAKELERQSKELIAFLQDKGYEVKVAQSSIEDEAIAAVRSHFGKGEQVQSQKPAAEEKAEEKPAQKPQENIQKPQDNAQKPQDNAQRAETGKAKEEAPKKKKIIFVSNPHNSKMQGQRPAQGTQQSRQGSGDRRSQNSNGGRPVQAQNVPHKIIRPTQKPIPVTAEPYEVRQRQQQERRLEERRREKESLAEKQRQEALEQERRAKQERQNAQERQAAPERQGGQNRPASQQQRPMNQERRGNGGEYRRNENQSRPGYNNGQNDRRNNGSAPGFHRNNDRPQRGNGGPDNRFKKNNNSKDFMPETPAKDLEKHREDEKRRANADRDKRSKKDLIYEEEETALKSRNKAGRFIKPEKKAEEPEEQIKVITIPESLTIK